MKRTNRIWSKGAQWICAGLLTLLGFSTCDKIPGGVEYGTPHAKFTVSGKVKNTQGSALSQIRVVVPQIIHYTPPRYGFIPDNPISIQKIGDTLFTKQDGSFEYTYDGFPTDTVRIFFKFEDSSLHPIFEVDSAKVHFIYSDLKGGNSWYKGRAQKEVNVTLKPKQEE